MYDQIQSTANFIKEQAKNFVPETGIILGTGLGGLVEDIKAEFVFPYESIPGFPVSTVEGHSGKLIFGKLSGKNVMAMQGRFHFYEGYDMQKVVYPVRVMKYLGVKRLFVSNASGGVNPEFEIGDLMIINDHINLFPSNPLIGPNDKRFGPRFPDMSEPYDHAMIHLAKKIGREQNIKLQEGVYVGMSGPTFETPAEYKYVRNIGGDTVGMSTVPEVIVARHMSVPVFAISVITDLGVPGKIVEVTHEDVQKAAEISEKKMTQLMKEMIARL
ncbi:MAG TPA: purine-nucleoside phosphorylase [Bacteroidia bacterium]|jgi:purine-nucleoside phosphorylase|nr:purine-nucleoside phosphorylase [Bacteroidia bacterium]